MGPDAAFTLFTSDALEEIRQQLFLQLVARRADSGDSPPMAGGRI